MKIIQSHDDDVIGEMPAASLNKSQISFMSKQTFPSIITVTKQYNIETWNNAAVI